MFGKKKAKDGDDAAVEELAEATAKGGKAPKAKKANPRPSKPSPKAYFTEAGGLYLLSHHLVNKGAKMMMNNEFKMANQVTGTSLSEV